MLLLPYLLLHLCANRINLRRHFCAHCTRKESTITLNLCRRPAVFPGWSDNDELGLHLNHVNLVLLSSRRTNVLYRGRRDVAHSSLWPYDRFASPQTSDIFQVPSDRLRSPEFLQSGKKIKARTRQSNRKEQAICKYDARTINLYIIAKPRAYLFFWQPQASSSNYIPEVSLPLGSPRDLRLPFVRVNISLSAGRPGLLLLRDGIIRTIQKLWTLRLNLVHVPTIYS